MKKRAWGLTASILAATLGVTSAAGVAAADEPPDEGRILLEELPNVLTRSGLGSLPPDPDTVAESLATLPHGTEDVIAMHLGRLYGTPHESLPGVGPLGGLLQARAGLLTDPAHLQKKGQDLASGEAALLVPFDPVTAIVILPTQVVRADPNATPMPQRPVDLSGVTYEINGQTRTVEQYLADGSTNAIAFAHDGEFLHDAYQNGFTADTRHHLWSATKSVTTALVGIAVEEGLVDSIHDPIETYIPGAAGTVWEGTSVEDLLQMESGIYWVDVAVHQPEQLVVMGADFHTSGLIGLTRDEYLLQLTRVSAPGEHHRYNSADTQMLAWLLENVYDDAYATILSEKIWQPAGMESDALITVDRTQDAFASMGLFATPRDGLRFGELFRNGGRNLQGEQVVPEAWVEASSDYTEETGGPRGYQWGRWSEGYTASGFGGQLISVAPAMDMVGARFGSDPVDSMSTKEFEAVYRAVADALGAGDPGEPDEPDDPGDPDDPDDPDDPGNGNAGGNGNGNAGGNGNGVGGGDGNGNAGGNGNGVGGGDGGGRDRAPGQQGVLVGAVTDAAPARQAPAALLALSLVLAAAAMLTRSRPIPR